MCTSRGARFNQSPVYLQNQCALQPLGARFPRIGGMDAGLPKCTRNLMAHDPFNARGADMKSREQQRRARGAKDFGGGRWEGGGRAIKPGGNPREILIPATNTHDEEIQARSRISREALARRRRASRHKRASHLRLPVFVTQHGNARSPAVFHQVNQNPHGVSVRRDDRTAIGR